MPLPRPPRVTEGHGSGHLRRVAFTLVFFCAEIITSIAAAKPCDFEPVSTVAPGSPLVATTPAPAVSVVRPYAFVRVRGADKNAPLTIHVEATGPATLRWSRFSTTAGMPDLHQRLQIARRPAGASDFEPFCVTGWVPVARLPGFANLHLRESSRVTWRIEVYQENRTPAISVLDEDLSELVIIGSIDPVVRIVPEPLPSFDSVRKLSARPPPLCGGNGSIPPTDSRHLRLVQLPGEALNVPGSVHVLSGRKLYLRIGHLAPGTPVTLSFEAKPIRFPGPAVPICTELLTQPPGSEGRWITATLPWEYDYGGDWVRWTVTLVGQRPSPKIAFQLLRDRPPSRPPVAEPRGPDVYSCTLLAPPQEQDVPEDLSAKFRAAHSLTVHTGLRELGVAGRPYHQIIDALLSAINNWRSACTLCTPYQFSVVAVDDQVYVPSGMLAGEPENQRATFATAYPWSTGVFVDKNTGFTTSAIPFVAVSSTIRQRQRFCNQRPELRFSAADSPLCRPTLRSTKDEMIIHVKWPDTALPCGDKAGAVACWNGTDLIKMNLHEFSFYAGDVGEVWIGASPRQADLVRVFTREVGHWLGLGHLSPDGNIMSEHFSAARCIDDAALAKLNAIAAGEQLRPPQAETLQYEP